MPLIQFIAPTAEAALKQIHAKLGPQAVVVSVRPLPVEGISRFLPNHRRIEVLASMPEACVPPGSSAPARIPGETGAGEAHPNQSWRSIEWLKAMGLSRENAQRLHAHATALQCPGGPDSLDVEWQAVRRSLDHFWREAPPAEDSSLPMRPHVFIGPPGSGKTSALCKWLTLSVLTEERTARVFRLDGSSANTSDYLDIHCETLGIPVERFWTAPAHRAELIFVDLPGVESGDLVALTALRAQLAGLPNPRIHLVLNAAYEIHTLLAQYGAFSPLEPDDLILTHFDEERRRVKLWNLVFEANCPIRFVSSGQKVPGEFQSAAPGLLLPVADATPGVSVAEIHRQGAPAC